MTAQTKTGEKETLFEKAAGIEKGEDIDILGEDLTVVAVVDSMAQKTLIVYGRHEDTDQKPRYEIVIDAQHDTVNIWPTRRTDTHSE